MGKKLGADVYTIKENVQNANLERLASPSLHLGITGHMTYFVSAMLLLNCLKDYL